MQYRIWSILLLVGALSACGTETLEAAGADTGDAAAQSSAKGTDASTNELFQERPHLAIVNGAQAATIEISLPKSMDSLHPGLAEEIRSRANRGTEAFIAAAEADRESAASEGFDFRPHSLDVSWIEVGPKEGRLAGFLGTYATYTGGAHPNVGFDVLNWDRETSTIITFEDLFENEDGARQTMADALKAGLLEQKRIRLEGTGVSEIQMMDAWVSPAFEGNAGVFRGFTVASSTVPDRAGGLIYHFAPYEVGAYAEGVYTVGVGHEEFDDELKAEFRDAFGGEMKMP